MVILRILCTKKKKIKYAIKRIMFLYSSTRTLMHARIYFNLSSVGIDLKIGKFLSLNHIIRMRNASVGKNVGKWCALVQLNYGLTCTKNQHHHSGAFLCVVLCVIVCPFITVLCTTMMVNGECRAVCEAPNLFVNFALIFIVTLHKQ